MSVFVDRAVSTFSLCVLFVLLFISMDNARALMNRNEDLSLDKTPYNDGRLYGMWSISGSTTVQEDFIRLTPELQSQAGSLWTAEGIAASMLGDE